MWYLQGSFVLTSNITGRSDPGLFDKHGPTFCLLLSASPGDLCRPPKPAVTRSAQARMLPQTARIVQKTGSEWPLGSTGHRVRLQTQGGRRAPLRGLLGGKACLIPKPGVECRAMAEPGTDPRRARACKRPELGLPLCHPHPRHPASLSAMWHHFPSAAMFWADKTAPKYLPHPGGASAKEPACQCRRRERHEFNPWVGRIPWRRKRQPNPVFLNGESHWQRSLVGYSPLGHRVGHNWSDLAHTHCVLIYNYWTVVIDDFEN